MTPLEQLQEFCKFESEMRPGRTHVCQWALKEIERLTVERDASLAASRHETDMCQQELEDLEKLTAERDSLCASCVQETKYNNAARGEIRKLTGESAVLRGLLKQAFCVLETITDEQEPDDWMLLMALKAKIVAAIVPQLSFERKSEETGDLL